MTYSKTLQKFLIELNKPEALTNLAKYLGPNWEDVLNFWIYLDTLSNKEKKEMAQSYRDLDNDVRDVAWNAATDAAEEVVCWEFRTEALYAAQYVTGSEVFGFATYELIAHHKILEQNKTPIFLPLCVKP